MILKNHTKMRLRVFFKTDLCVLGLLLLVAFAVRTRSIKEENTLPQLEALPYLGGSSAPEETQEWYKDFSLRPC